MMILQKIKIYLILLAISTGVTFGWGKYQFYQGCVKTEKLMRTAMDKEAMRNQIKTVNNREIVYQKVVESSVIFKDKVRKVYIYVENESNYNHTFNMPVASLCGYNASIYNGNAESPNELDGKLCNAESITDTQKP